MVDLAVNHHGHEEVAAGATKHSKTLEYATTLALSEKLGLTVTRLPSDTTSRRILHRLDFHLLAEQFQQ